MHDLRVSSFATFPSAPVPDLAVLQQRRLRRSPSAPPVLWQPPVALPDSYDQVEERLHQPNYIDRYYNAADHQKLRTFEAAMDFLAVKLAYRLKLGQHLRFNIQRTYIGTACTGVDRLYRVTDSLVGRQGCVVHRLQPYDASKNAMIVFRGTMREANPSGLRTNTEFRGAGASAFAEVREQVTQWVYQAHASGQRVNIVGHSLGGACGLRLLAGLPDALQNICTVNGAATPRVWRDILPHIADDGAGIFIVNGRRDIVSYGGHAWPRKARICTVPGSGYYDHCTPFLARQELDGERLRLKPFRPSWVGMLPIETFRKSMGMFGGACFRV